MNRLTRNVLAFVIGVWFSISVVKCAHAASRETDTEDSVSAHPTFAIQLTVCGRKDKIILLTNEGQVFIAEQQDLGSGILRAIWMLKQAGQYHEEEIAMPPGVCK